MIRTRESFEALRTKVLGENEEKLAALSHALTIATMELKLWADMSYDDYTEAMERFGEGAGGTNKT